MPNHKQPQQATNFTTFKSFSQKVHWDESVPSYAYEDNERPTVSIAYSPNGSFLAEIQENRSVNIREASTGVFHKVISPGDPNYRSYNDNAPGNNSFRLAWSSDSQLLAFSLKNSKNVTVVRADTTFSEVATLSIQNPKHQLAPNNLLFFSQSSMFPVSSSSSSTHHSQKLSSKTAASTSSATSATSATSSSPSHNNNNNKSASCDNCLIVCCNYAEILVFDHVTDDQLRTRRKPAGCFFPSVLASKTLKPTHIASKALFPERTLKGLAMVPACVPMVVSYCGAASPFFAVFDFVSGLELDIFSCCGCGDGKEQGHKEEEGNSIFDFAFGRDDETLVALQDCGEVRIYPFDVRGELSAAPKQAVHPRLQAALKKIDFPASMCTSLTSNIVVTEDDNRSSFAVAQDVHSSNQGVTFHDVATGKQLAVLQQVVGGTYCCVQDPTRPWIFAVASPMLELFHVPVSRVRFAGRSKLFLIKHKKCRNKQYADIVKLLREEFRVFATVCKFTPY